MAEQEKLDVVETTLSVEEQPSSDGEAGSSTDGWLTILISHRGKTTKFGFSPEATVSDLFKDCEICYGIPMDHIKFLVPKGRMLKTPLQDADMALAPLEGKTLRLLGSSAAQVKAVDDMCESVSRRARQLQSQRATMRSHPVRRQPASGEDSRYTFLQIRPLGGLPHPEKSERLLRRLKEDPGIRAVMKKHKLTVGLLTEMEPLSNTQTTYEGTSRLLGLNRNHGEAIELRLRTDAHDGYRDYKTIRKTLCHELTHNVHGPHNREFWELCRQIEGEVQAADWKSGGHTIAPVSRYTIAGYGEEEEEEEEEHQDDGGWTGGEFVLGGGEASTSAQAGLSRREILANAALERQKKEDKAEQRAEQGWRPCQRPNQRNNDEK